MRRWAEAATLLAMASVLALPASPAEAQGSQCRCRAAFDPCLVGDWLMPSEAVHPHWRASAAHLFGLKVHSTRGQVELAIGKDRLFRARVALDSTASGQGGLRVASKVTGAPAGRVCVAVDGTLCTYGVEGDIRVSNRIKLAGQSVAAPGLAVPAAGGAGRNEQAYPYRCTAQSLELTFTNLGKRERITARRR